MRIIALMNQKGGVGKTTTTANLGAALAELGKRICLIDLDPQAHLTINYGVEPSGDHASLYDVLVDECSFLEAIHKIDNRVALMPSSIDLAAAEVELVSVPGRESLLKKKMESAQHDFDFVLLDCPPSLGLLTLNALSVATEVLIPMQPHFLALQGVAKLLETVHLVSRRINPSLKVTGVILTMFDSQTRLSGEVVAELNNFIAQASGKNLPWSGAKVFRQKIRRNIKLAECPSFGQTILKYDPSSNGAADYRNLARELLGLPPAAPAPAKVTVTAARATGARASGLAVPAAKLVAASTARQASSANPPRLENPPAAVDQPSPVDRPPAPAPPPKRSAPSPARAAAASRPASTHAPAAPSPAPTPPPKVEVTINPAILPARIPLEPAEPELATADIGDVTDL